jgi:hypothetical protein
MGTLSGHDYSNINYESYFVSKNSASILSNMISRGEVIKDLAFL